MRQTSILAYRSLNKDKLNERQTEVYGIIEDYYPNAVNDAQIAEALGWSINRVTPRRGELLAKGKITEAYIGVGVTGRKTTFWKPVNTRGEYELADLT